MNELDNESDTEASALAESLVNLLAAEEDAFRQLSEQVLAYPGLMTQAALGQLASEILPEEAVDAVVLLVTSVAPENVEKFGEFVIGAMGDHRAELEKVQVRLATLWKAKDRFWELQKSNAVSRATGNEIVGVGVICESRPIYDHDRESILGFIPLVVASFRYENVEEQKAIVEFTLTESDLDFLITRLEAARHKLDVLKNKLETK